MIKPLTLISVRNNCIIQVSDLSAGFVHQGDIPIYEPDTERVILRCDNLLSQATRLPQFNNIISVVTGWQSEWRIDYNGALDPDVRAVHNRWYSSDSPKQDTQKKYRELDAQLNRAAEIRSKLGVPIRA